jgi:alpha-glucosidase (family GH31 glycosyl hydrolase)
MRDHMQPCTRSSGHRSHLTGLCPAALSFFHGLKFTDALRDYQLIGGKAIMVPRYAMGIWWR